MVEQVTRRERYRQQTINEIKTLAMEQVTDGGVATVSLNAIARTMAMSPGALYRYFDNRRRAGTGRPGGRDEERPARRGGGVLPGVGRPAAEHLPADLRKPHRLGRGDRHRTDHGGGPAQHGHLAARAE